MRAAEAASRDDCALEAMNAAAQLCPRLLADAPARIGAREEARREAHGRVEAFGPWFVEVIQATGESRVWERDGAKVELRARLRIADEFAVDGRGRLRARGFDELVFVEPRTGVVHRMRGQSFLAENADFVFVGGAGELRRLKAPDLAPAGVVAASGGLGGRVLRGGEQLLAGDVLVSFATGSVVRSGVSLGGIRQDEARALACDEATPDVVEVDATTGKELVRFALPPNADCHTGEPAYGPDPRFAFWLEPGPETRHRGLGVIVASGDTQTGKVRRLLDREAAWSIAFHSREHLDADGDHLCADLSSFHTGWTLCEWRLAKDGSPVRAPKRGRGPTPSLSAIGLTGAIELGRAWTPRRARQLVLSFRSKRDEKRDLRLAIVDARGSLEHAAILEAGELFFDDSRLTRPDDVNAVDLPTIAAIDEHHAVFQPGTGSLEPMWIDLRTGAVDKPCHGHDACSLSGRFRSDGEGGVRDLVTGEAWVLAPSREAWSAAPRIGDPCPAPPDACPCVN